jgi:conjugal transfer pilus assembly protein TraE
MLPKNAINDRASLQGQVKFQRVIIVSLIGMVFALFGLEAYTLIRQTTVVVPPEVRRAYEVGANYADKDYLLDMGAYVLGMVMTVTPETVDHNNSVILKMTHPDGYATLKTFLDAAALRLKRERVTTIWVPRDEKVNVSAKTVEVSGKLKTYIADKLTSEREKNYLVEFTVTVSGRLYVSKIEEIVKRDSTPVKPASQS